MLTSLKFLLPVAILFTTMFTASAQKQKVWIDADTGNETDDIYAIVRALDEPSIEVVGLSSAHFNNADLVAFDKWNQYNTHPINTVQISQQLNEEALQKTGKLNIPHPIGADRQMGRAWGGREPRNSPAAQQIIKAVQQLGKNEKLAVICLGALTNVASAMALDTSIVSRLTLYVLGAQYNVNKAYWNKSEFNIRNDLNAFDYLLDNPKVNITVMTITSAASYRFNRDSLYAALSDGSPVKKMLKHRWIETNPDDKERTLWDLCLVEAFLNPGLVTTKEVLTPPENTPRLVKVFSWIDAEKLKMDFFGFLRGVRE